MSQDQPNITETEIAATEQAACERAALELWQRDPNADSDKSWVELAGSTRDKYREDAKAVIKVYLQVYLDTMLKPTQNAARDGPRLA